MRHTCAARTNCPENAHYLNELSGVLDWESGHNQLNYYLGFRKYATYMPKWSIDQLRPIVIQEIAVENTVGLRLLAAEIEVAE